MKPFNPNFPFNEETIRYKDEPVTWEYLLLITRFIIHNLQTTHGNVVFSPIPDDRFEYFGNALLKKLYGEDNEG